MNAGGFAGIPWIASSPWAYPALEVVHIVGIALLLGNPAAFVLRVAGAAPELPIRPLARLALTLALAGFGLVVLSGVLMFAAGPEELLASTVFVAKMGLVMLAGLNAAWFHARGGLARIDATARVQTVLSLGLWLVVVILGRWIGYS